MGICSECGQEESIFVDSIGYNYTKHVGLNPDEYSIILEETTVYSCKCGFSAVIHDMERLHEEIADMIVNDERGVLPSGARFLRRHAAVSAN